MKASTTFLVLACSLIINENFGDKIVEKTVESDNENSFVAVAIGEILEKFYAEENHRVDVLCFPCKNRKLFDLSNEIPKKDKNEITFKVVKASEKTQINVSTIMLFDTKADHNRFAMQMTFDWDLTAEKFHSIYYPGLSRDVQRTPDNLAYKNVNYIENTNKTHLTLFTFEYFTEKHCGKPQKKMVNFFSKTTQKWLKNENFFPDKFKNFHGCIRNYGRPHRHFMNEPPRKGKKFGGQYYEMNKAIAKKLNISSRYWFCPLNVTANNFFCVNNSSISLALVLQLFYVTYSHRSLVVLHPFNFKNNAGFLIPTG
jgi:hypothetical protein